MRAFYHPDQALHAPRQFMRYGVLTDPTDLPVRTERLLGALQQLGVEIETPSDYGREPALAVHPAHYLDYLDSAYPRWLELPNHGPEVLPNTFPYWNGDPAKDARPPCPTDQLLAQTGYYLGDLAVPISEFTYRSALRSTHTSTAAAEAVIAGEAPTYALCRPSGHHCRADRATGFCYMNNAAIAAQRLRSSFGKVAILDIDAHHGDGTQEIFYRRNDVMTVSVHVDTDHYNPFFTGRPHERGHGAGEGYNLNIPLAPGSGDEAFLAAVRDGAKAVTDFGAEVVVVALGYDTHAEDPLSMVKVTTEAFRQAGEIIGSMDVPKVIVQEGGYQISVIGDCLFGFLDACREPR
ncbi:histone deacetylase family protein [Aliihoeflea aestuarii]|jgi:acetoin utilization deacetylase AcuC-like enzyme|uniref:histone deacetylase family protein n=1 Tax=Aliihoeflea aestuarii TaxID=453840 RepID=UPI002095EBF1|nr:histone deacetylase family protein [Aliihoeflea aestuarii]MCO6392995.1 histone deacetylase family protein [Aliihoeflea aestuarii]